MKRLESSRTPDGRRTNGGARSGAGQKRGARWPVTLSKIEAREEARKLIVAELGPLIAAQIRNAMGIDHFFLRDSETGEFRRIVDPDQIQAALTSPNAAKGSTYWINTQAPNVQAFTDLMNRCLDKPAGQEQALNLGGHFVFTWAASE